MANAVQVWRPADVPTWVTKEDMMNGDDREWVVVAKSGDEAVGEAVAEVMSRAPHGGVFDRQRQACSTFTMWVVFHA
jgi:hypothetical protein